MELILKSAEISIPHAIENLEQLKAEIAPKMEYYRSLVVTEESIRSAKADRANLNKLKKAISDQRIAVKKQCLAPYEALECECRELEALIIAPIAAIDAQIKAFEEIEKNKKYSELKIYFESVNNLEFLVLDDVLNSKWSNKTFSVESLKEEMLTNINRISGDYEQLRIMYQNSPLLTPIINKFTEKKELSPVLVYAAQLEKELEKEQKRTDESNRKAIENTIDIPVKINEIPEKSSEISPDVEPEITGAFRVTCTKDQLIMLRDFMKSQGIKFEVVKERSNKNGSTEQSGK